MVSLGARIKQARILKSFSQRDLAEMVGVSHTAISKYEKEQDIPGSGVLIRIAKSLGVKLDFFYRPITVEVTTGSYRKKSSMTKTQEEAVKIEIQDWLERYVTIESILNTNPTEFSIPTMVNRKINTVEEADRVADELRNAWDLGTDPIPNLTEVLEDKGIKVGFIKGNEKFDGYNFYAVNLGPVIVIKENLPGDRQRFNLAHELGHVVLEHDETVDAEIAAHRFAGAFLVPDSAAFHELGEKRSKFSVHELHSLKTKYGISMQAWVRRAFNLGIISENAYQNISKQFSMRGWRKKEPLESLPSEKTERMDRMILRAYSENLITEIRASELLGRSIKEFL